MRVEERTAEGTVELQQNVQPGSDTAAVADGPRSGQPGSHPTTPEALRNPPSLFLVRMPGTHINTSCHSSQQPLGH